MLELLLVPVVGDEGSQNLINGYGQDDKGPYAVAQVKRAIKRDVDQDFEEMRTGGVFEPGADWNSVPVVGYIA